MHAPTCLSILELCDLIRETAYAIHKYLGHGHLEKVYETALLNRLSAGKIKVQSQFPLSVFDEDGSLLGEYYADLWIEDRLIVELKACPNLNQAHSAQLLGYLKSSGIEHGLLINFGSYPFQIRKYAFNPNLH